MQVLIKGMRIARQIARQHVLQQLVMAETSPGFTANRAVNSVAAVCAADPGIRTTLDLPHIVPFLAH